MTSLLADVSVNSDTLWTVVGILFAIALVVWLLNAFGGWRRP